MTYGKLIKFTPVGMEMEEGSKTALLSSYRLEQFEVSRLDREYDMIVLRDQADALYWSKDNGQTFERVIEDATVNG